MENIDVNANWKPGDPIGYIREEIPEFEQIQYRGSFHEELVPDTLDLEDRAALAINAMTEPTDPQADYEVYWWVNFTSHPAQMFMKRQLAKFVEAVPLMRLMSGSKQNLNVEQRWKEVILKSLGPDGLYYEPRKGRPWDHEPQHLMEFGASPDIMQYCDPFDCGRVLSAIAVTASQDSNPVWQDAMVGIAKGLDELAVHKGDEATFWPQPFMAMKPPAGKNVFPIDIFGQENSRVPHGLIHAYRQTGYEPALGTAKQVLNYLRRHYFEADGGFIGSPESKVAHFHAHAHALLAMEEYAEITGDSDMMDFVVMSYERAKMYSTSATKSNAADYTYSDVNMGGNLIGYFSEFVNSPEWEGVEICQVADMIALALRLSDHGVMDCWDDVDRWTRNIFAEGQLLRTDWIDRVYDKLMPRFNLEWLLPSEKEIYGSSEDVGRRNRGAFMGWAAANDWHVNNGPGIMHCCTGNGSLALYRIWERILRYDEGKLRVNLLLNRTSQWADVNSHIPYVGRVDVNVKTAAELSIRIPEWVTPEQTGCTVNGAQRRLGWDGRYAIVGAVVPGDKVTLTFPIFERVNDIWIEKEHFTLVRKGNDVVSIDPSGKFCPLFQRQHYREDDTRYRYKKRYLSDNKLIVW